MARGFGVTFGAATTDMIQTSLTTHSATRSYHIWAYREASGGSGFGRMFDKDNGGGARNILYNDAGTVSYVFVSTWGGSDGSWSIIRPSNRVWHGIGVSYDNGAASNDPVFYVDGVSTSLNTDVNPTGSPLTSADAYTIGNRQSDSGRHWDGMLCEAAIWDAILTAAEFQALGVGVSPALVRPQSLVLYEPMLRDNIDLRQGGTPTITGTVVQPHPRVIYPVGPFLQTKAVAAAVGKPWHYYAQQRVAA